MNKRLVCEYKEFLYKGEETPFSLGALTVTFFCAVLLIVATFVKVDISHFWFQFTDDGIKFISKTFQLVPQIPVVLFTAALLGARFSTLSVLIYLLVGFFLWPVFAFGGGLGYVKSYFFGYILGFFIASIFSGRILSIKYSLKNVVFASVIGVLAIHLSGILYSFILGFFNSSHYSPNFPLIFTQIIYDIVFSILAILISRPAKYILWVAMKNEPKNPKVNKTTIV